MNPKPTSSIVPINLEVLSQTQGNGSVLEQKIVVLFRHTFSTDRSIKYFLASYKMIRFINIYLVKYKQHQIILKPKLPFLLFVVILTYSSYLTYSSDQAVRDSTSPISTK
jgi:hypothetical protein